MEKAKCITQPNIAEYKQNIPSTGSKYTFIFSGA